jgi:hypothetical protein
MKKIFFQLYNPCGLFNQITSIELGVGLSFLTNRQLVWHNISNPPNGRFNNSRIPIYSANYDFNDRNGKIDLGVFPKITDLLDWNGKENNIFIDDIVDVFSSESKNITNLMQYYYSKDEDLDFSEGRSLFDLDENFDWDIRKTLGYYSRFFNNRTVELDTQLSSVRFKKEYYELAEKIAKSIGDFNGAHLRLTDHIKMINTGSDVFNDGLERLSEDLPIVLSTDEPSSEVVSKSKKKVLLLDRYILKNFYDEFRQLEFKEEVSFGIVNNLVMHYSNDFIGTPGSTYTGYIHRNINQNKNIGFKLFGEKEHKQVGNYSWNGHNKDSFTKQWWREWEESKLKKQH